MHVSPVSPTAKRQEDFTSLGTALQSGNVTRAQSAFATFLQDVQAPAAPGSSNPFAPGTQAGKDLQMLGNALRSANIAGAQKAFATLQQDLQGAAPTANITKAGSAFHTGGTGATTASGTSASNVLNVKA